MSIFMNFSLCHYAVSLHMGSSSVVSPWSSVIRRNSCGHALKSHSCSDNTVPRLSEYVCNERGIQATSEGMIRRRICVQIA